jgi:hypothetical protein
MFSSFFGSYHLTYTLLKKDGRIFREFLLGDTVFLIVDAALDTVFTAVSAALDTVSAAFDTVFLTVLIIDATGDKVLLLAVIAGLGMLGTGTCPPLNKDTTKNRIKNTNAAMAIPGA